MPDPRAVSDLQNYTYAGGTMRHVLLANNVAGGNPIVCNVITSTATGSTGRCRPP